MAFIKVGTLLCETISITNGWYATATNTTVTFSIPTGMVVENATPTKGTFSKVTSVWSVGTVAYKETPSIYLCLRVTDDSQPLYKLTWTVASDECDIDESNNTGEIIFDVFSCAAVQDCVDIDLDIKMESFTITDEDGRLDTIFPDDTEVDLDPSLHMGPSGHIADSFLGVSGQASSQGDLAAITTAHDNVVQGSSGSTISSSDRTGVYSGSTISILNGTNVFATGTNYIADTIDNSLVTYKHVGTPITMGTISASIISGLTHAAIDGVDNSVVSGSGHDIGAMTDSLVVGTSNTVDANILASIISGNGNTINNTVTNSLVSGSTNTVYVGGSMLNSYIGGGSNLTHSALYQSQITGFDIQVNLGSGYVENSILLGSHHNLVSTDNKTVKDSIIGGVDNDISGDEGLIWSSSVFGSSHNIDGGIQNCSLIGTGVEITNVGSIASSFVSNGVASNQMVISSSVAGSYINGNASTSNPSSISRAVRSSIISGDELDLGGSNSLIASLIIGDGITTATNGEIINSLVAGKDNSSDGIINHSIYNGQLNVVGSDGFIDSTIVMGTVINVNGGISKCAVFGQNHTLYEGFASLVTGSNVTTELNSVCQNNIIGGFNNTIDATANLNNSLVLGESVTISGETLHNSLIITDTGIIAPTNIGTDFVFAFGDSVEAYDTHQVVIGDTAIGATTHSDSWVICDSNGLTSDSANRFHAKFANGYKLFTDAGGTTGATMLAGLSAWSAVSSESYKDNFEQVNYTEMLQKFDAVDIKKWTYKNHDTKHIGITAEDFYSITGKDIANEPDRISTTNSDGAMMAIMKGMYGEIKKLQDEIKQLKS